MSTQFTDLQLDALRELANIGSGTAAPRCRRCSGRPSTSPSRPRRRCRSPTPSRRSARPSSGHRRRDRRRRRHGGHRPAPAGRARRRRRCAACSASTRTRDGAVRPRRDRQHPRRLLHQRAGRDDRPRDGARAAAVGHDMLGAIVASVLAGRAARRDIALVLDSDLKVEGEDCSMSFLLVPSPAASRSCSPASDWATEMAEIMVRMGEFACPRTAGDVLVSLGLGSCIGLALIDRRAAVAGLAHVVLPARRAARHPGQVRRHRRAGADRRAWCALGARRIAPRGRARRRRQMFSFGAAPASTSASATTRPCARRSTRCASRSPPRTPAASPAAPSA